MPFEKNAVRTQHTRYFILRVEIKDYSVMINGKNVIDQPVKNDIRTNNDTRKIVKVRGDDYPTGCVLYYLYFKESCKIIAIDLS